MADPIRRRGPLDDARLTNAYRLATPDSADPHVSEVQWEQLACGELDADALASVHAHITGCGRCAEIHHSLTALADGASQFDPQAMAPVTVRPPSRLWMTLGGLAAAAAIFAVVRVDLRAPHTEPTIEVTRSQGGPVAIAIVAPKPDTALVARRFAWQAVAAADSYELRINTADGGAAWSVRTSGTDATVPVEHALAAGRYYWQVTAFRETTAIATSPLSAFRVE